MSDSSPLWERQTWDTPAGYEAFKDYYLPQDPARRSLDEAYRRYFASKNGQDVGGPGVTHKKPPGAWQRWFRALDHSGKAIPGSIPWENRAQAHDARLARLEIDQFEKDRLRNKKQRLRVLEGALAQVTLIWSQLDYAPKTGPDGRRVTAPLPPFKDATSALRVVLNELRAEYDDTPAQRLQVGGPDGRPLPGFIAGHDFSDMNDDDLHDRIREYESRRAGTVPGPADGAGAPGTGADTDPLADGEE